MPVVLQRNDFVMEYAIFINKECKNNHTDINENYLKIATITEIIKIIKTVECEEDVIQYLLDNCNKMHIYITDIEDCSLTLIDGIGLKVSPSSSRFEVRWQNIDYSRISFGRAEVDFYLQYNNYRFYEEFFTRELNTAITSKAKPEVVESIIEKAFIQDKACKYAISTLIWHLSTGYEHRFHCSHIHIYRASIRDNRPYSEYTDITGEGGLLLSSMNPAFGASYNTEFVNIFLNNIFLYKHILGCLFTESRLDLKSRNLEVFIEYTKPVYDRLICGSILNQCF